MISFDLVLLIIAAICFGLAALGIGVPRINVNLVALGLLAWVLSILL